MLWMPCSRSTRRTSRPSIGVSVWLLVHGGETNELTLMVYGSLGPSAGMAISYWLGSSRTQDSAHATMAAREGL